MKTKIAIVQKPAALLNLKESLKLAASYIAEAASGGAELIVFPETWLTGYPAWVFGMAGWGDETARKWHAKLLQESARVGSATDFNDDLAKIREAAKTFQVTVSLGLNEKSHTGATLYNSLVLIGDNGELLNHHRKLMPTHTERIVWGLGDANGLKAVDTKHGKVGGLICWEHWMPLARQTLHQTGEQIHIAAWPDITYAHELAARSYAFEGRCFVISAGLFITKDDVPADLLDAYLLGVDAEKEHADILFDGGSHVVSPQGLFIVEPVRNKAAIIFAELDLNEVDEGHQDLDVAGHYARPDVFQLNVDNRRQEGITFKTT